MHDTGDQTDPLAQILFIEQIRLAHIPDPFYRSAAELNVSKQFVRSNGLLGRADKLHKLTVEYMADMQENHNYITPP